MRKYANKEIYFYTKTDFIPNVSIINFPDTTNKKANIGNTCASIYSCENIIVGSLYTTSNNTVINNIVNATVEETLSTPSGILVYKFSFNNSTSLNTPFFFTDDILITTNAIYKSGKYSNYDNIQITIQTLNDNDGTRIVTVLY